MGSGQFGGGKVGGVSLAAATMVPQDFRAMPHVCVRDLLLTVNLSVKNAAAATTNLVISTGASAASEGTDDLDLILNAIFTNLTMFWDEDTMAFSLSPAQLRTVLGLFNQRDFAGSVQALTVANSVPATGSSAKAVTVVINIPVSLKKYFEDGDIFKNGSRRLSGGSIQYTCGSSLTPSVVCANATIAVSGVSVNLYALAGSGTEDDVGNLWKIERKASLPTIYEFDGRPRLAMLDVTVAGSNVVSAYNIGPFGLVDPTTLQGKFQIESLPQGGFDITNRCTPLITMDRWRKFLDFQAMMHAVTKIEAVSGVSSLTLYDVTAIVPSEQAVANVAQRAASGGPVQIEHPTPSSLPPGTSIPASVAHALPVRVRPAGSPHGGGSLHVAANPQAAAARVTANKGVAARIGNVLRAKSKF
jgi:hypothetical protein